MKTFHIKTHGCQMNEHDSSRMRDLLVEQCHMRETQQAEEADLLLVNTCSIREKAAEKVFHQLGRWKQHKRARQALIGVGGCVASQEGAAIQERAQCVDLIFGPQTIHRLPQMIADALARPSQMQNQAIVDISFPEIEKFDALPEPRHSGAQASVSIMEGCSKYCSFCVVPYTRGEEVSRPLDDVLAEIAVLGNKGAKEITLLGQNVNAWRGRNHLNEQLDFAELLHCVAGVTSIERLRYTTSHPMEFSQDLIDCHAEIDKLVAHVHLPAQSGSDKILAAMKRGYTALEFKSITRRLRAARPGISISSDFIVGFPGESQRDFEATLALIDEVSFDNSFSFLYSPRPGTPAASLPDATPLAEKKARLSTLQILLRRHAEKISQDMVGTRQAVLASGRSKKNQNQWQGRTENNRVVNFSHPDSKADLEGQMLQVVIDKALPNCLIGKAVATA